MTLNSHLHCFYLKAPPHIMILCFQIVMVQFQIQWQENVSDTKRHQEIVVLKSNFFQEKKFSVILAFMWSEYRQKTIRHVPLVLYYKIFLKRETLKDNIYLFPCICQGMTRKWLSFHFHSEQAKTCFRHILLILQRCNKFQLSFLLMYILFVSNFELL